MAGRTRRADLVACLLLLFRGLRARPAEICQLRLQRALECGALLAALLVGVTAPVVGIYLVQRRLALIGDGIGHVALTGVALGVLTGAAPVLTALVQAVR